MAPSRPTVELQEGLGSPGKRPGMEPIRPQPESVLLPQGMRPGLPWVAEA